MTNSKAINFMAIGAIVGLALSMADRKTRASLISTSKNIGESVSYYSHNTDELKEKAITQAKKAHRVYTQIQEDGEFVMKKVNQLKDLAPPAKDLAVQTKDALSETKEAVVKTKEDMVAAVKEDPGSTNNSNMKLN